jgi:hypothetical protein
MMATILNFRVGSQTSSTAGTVAPLSIAGQEAQVAIGLARFFRPLTALGNALLLAAQLQDAVQRVSPHRQAVVFAAYMERIRTE